jgi:hypothetical protein
MSEFQIHQFKTIDRPLDKAAREYMSSLSSRARVTATSAEYVNHYSDFRGDIDKITLLHFDVSLYWANFGCRRVLFKFPKSAKMRERLEPYMFGEHIEMIGNQDCDVLIFDENDEGSNNFQSYLEDESPVDMLVSLRNDMLRGDLRAVYMM